MRAGARWRRPAPARLVPGGRWAAAVLALAVALGASPARAGPLWLLSASRVELRPGERIVGFELTVTSGRIAALPSAPVGWSVHVENYPSWRTTASGGALVGAAALDPAELTDLAVVEAYEPGAGRFEVTLVLSVTADFDRRRSVVVPRDRLDLRPR